MKPVAVRRDEAAAATLEGRIACHDVRDGEGRVARGAVGEGVEGKGYSGGQWTLAAAHRGLLRVREAALAQVNAQPGIAVFTLYDLQPVEAGEIVARAQRSRRP